MKEDELLTLEQVAEILHLSKNTVQSRRWQLKWKCPLIKKGKRRYAISSEFRAWFKHGSN